MSAAMQIITIHDLAYGGDGVGRLADGRAVFVPFTIPGEEVEVEIVEEKKRFCRGRIKDLRVPSDFRVEPKCPLFGRCGGCQYQHIAYSEQVRLKGGQLVETLRRLGRLDVTVPVDPVIPSPHDYHYRNKLTLEPFELDGHRDYGFFSHIQDAYVPIDHCPLADPAINVLLPAARRSAKREKAGGKRLLLRHPSHGKTRMFLGKPMSHTDWLTEELAGRRIKVPYQSFWQVNPPVGAALAATVARWARAASARRLIDAYAGVGLFSLTAGTAVEQVTLIESDAAAIKASRWNHQHLGLKGRAFVVGRTEKVLPGLLTDLGKHREQALVVLDPPRGGCDRQVLRALRATPVPAMIYVSCNPSSLARDLTALVDPGGYQVERIGLADMFPQTAHFESLVFLRHSRFSV